MVARFMYWVADRLIERGCVSLGKGVERRAGWIAYVDKVYDMSDSEEYRER